MNNPRYLIQSEEKLAQIQRWHSRKKLKSQNRGKSRLKVAKLHEKITNQRQNFLHQLSRKMVNTFQLIAFEKLNIKGMAKNRYLAKSISDASWSRFLQMLKWKAAEANIWAVEVSAKNTSQTCSGCGSVVPKSLAIRRHKCPKCGLAIDRDTNAAKNILQLALTTVGTTGIHPVKSAKGGAAKPQFNRVNACGVGRLLPTIKQEAIGFNRW